MTAQETVNGDRDLSRDEELEPGAYEQTPEELALDDEDDHTLPWLESDDYLEENEGKGLGRLLAVGLIGLIVIGALLYGAYYLINRPDAELVADGSTIEAPEGPMKERPEDPGGKQFEGTGDVAPAVGQGQTREGQVATDPAPSPSVDAAGSQAPSASQSSGVGVQVGAYSTRERAQEGWSTLNRQTDALQGYKHRVMEGQIDSGTVYRLQAVASDGDAARSLCETLKSQGIACQVKR